jgi:hypothetical protein
MMIPTAAANSHPGASVEPDRHSSIAVKQLPQRPVALAEAARLFQEIGAGPSRSTLSRDAGAGILTKCRDLKAGRTQARYRFADLCSVYGIDPTAPTRPPGAKRRGGSSPHAPETPTSSPALSSDDVAALSRRIDSLFTVIDSMRSEVASAVRDLTEVRKRLQLKYDTENGLLRNRAEVAEARVRESEALNSLTREVTALRQAVTRAVDSRQGAG